MPGGPTGELRYRERDLTEDECYEADKQAIRALLVEHGYDPDDRPAVCELDGVPVDGHEDSEHTGRCVHCGKEMP
jgi:hypothetical protein